MFGRDYKYLEQSLKDNAHPTIFSSQILPFSFHDSGNSNLIYATKQGTVASNNHIYIMAFGADRNYAQNSSGVLISPSIATPNVTKYYRAFMNHVGVLGTGNLSKATEPFDVYVRTTNITTDATSGWNLLSETNDISSYA
jgi:hypothetical protein